MNACAWRRRIQFAECSSLAEANGWPESQVKELWDNGNNSAVALDKKIPVHMVYFTAVVDDDGKVESFADVYGLDRKLAAALFGDTTGFPQPPPEPPSLPRPKRPPAGRGRRAGMSGAPASPPRSASSTIRLTPPANRVWRGAARARR